MSTDPAIPGSAVEHVLFEARLREMQSRSFVPSTNPDVTHTLLSHELHETFQEMVRYRNLYLAAEQENVTLRNGCEGVKEEVRRVRQRLARLEARLACQEGSVVGAVVDVAIQIQTPGVGDNAGALHAHMLRTGTYVTTRGTSLQEI